MSTKQPRTHDGLLQTSRRRFFRTAAMAAAAASLPRLASPNRAAERPAQIKNRRASSRADRVYAARLDAARFERNQPVVDQRSNGDDELYPQRWGSYTKGLPHNSAGEVDAAAYRVYLSALESDNPTLFERVPLAGYVKLANPEAAHAIDLIGPDATKITTPPAPPFASAEQAAELVELYWQALLRDVPFTEYESNAIAAEAAAELTAMTGFRAVRDDGRITARSLFRGDTAGGRRGPWVSQFLLRDIPMSPIRVPHRIRTAIPKRDFMTDRQEWLAIQNGQIAGPNTFDPTPRYIRNGRDLGEYVHRDFTYQAALCACMMLLKMSAPLDGAIPSQYSIVQGGFITYGAPDVLHLVATVANLVLKASWYQKWAIHRRMRPEEMAGRVDLHLSGKGESPLHRDLLDARALKLTQERFGSWLLPQAYPEGAPCHPAYPSGHAVALGACVTVLKAFFAENWILPNPVVASPDGTELVPYKGEALTVGGELDKLAENVAIGRNLTGIHWRTDAVEGIRFGEEFAIRFLREMKLTANELFGGFSVRRFDGTSITI